MRVCVRRRAPEKIKGMGQRMKKESESESEFLFSFTPILRGAPAGRAAAVRRRRSSDRHAHPTMATRHTLTTAWTAWTRGAAGREGASRVMASAAFHPPSRSTSSSSSSGSTAGGSDGAAPPPSPYRVISIDRAGLARGSDDRNSEPAPPPPSFPSPLFPESALTPHLRSLITFRGGPISVAEYMATCLTHPTAGYYTSKASVFGSRGDFVTGPEVSQLMGELVGVWCASEWAGPLGRPPAVRLVELGPGKGTLMADLLRGAVGLAGGAWAEAIAEVVLVEVSPARRAEQWRALACAAAGGGTPSPPPSTDGNPPIEKALSLLTVPKGTRPLPITWAASVSEVPAAGQPTLYLAHEFFDALPVHHFERVDAGQQSNKKRREVHPSSPSLPSAAAWRERLVDASPPGDPGPPFRFVLAPGPTPASATILPRRLESLSSDVAASLTGLEVCPAGMAAAADLARRVSGAAGRGELEKDGGHGGSGDGSGAALIIDYGREGPPYADSLVGIANHAPAGILTAPGTADLSARVDFGALASAALSSEGGGPEAVAVHGPIPQAHFLLGLGLAARLGALEAAAGGPETDAGRAVRLGALRLVGGHEVEEESGAPAPPGSDGEEEDASVEGMGFTYQAMALTRAGRGAPAPF